MSRLLKTLRNLLIVGIFALGIVVAAGSFGLFGCQCPEQYRPDPPVYQPRPEPAWSTSQGTNR